MASGGPIPRWLHQTWKTRQVPEEWVANVGSWRALHPHWEYRLWTDEDNRAFVAKHYPELLHTFDGYPYNIMRADVVRYCLLHHYGGVYADLDIECLKPVDELLDGASFVALHEPAEQSAWLGETALLSNAFLASRPGHRFLEAVLRRLSSDPAGALTHRDVLATTGPLMLTQVFRDYRAGDVAILPPHTVFPYRRTRPSCSSWHPGILTPNACEKT